MRKCFPREERMLLLAAAVPCIAMMPFIPSLFSFGLPEICWCWRKTDNRVLSCSIEARLLTSSCGSASSSFSFQFASPSVRVETLDFSAVDKLLIFKRKKGYVRFDKYMWITRSTKDLFLSGNLRIIKSKTPFIGISAVNRRWKDYFVVNGRVYI